MFIRAFLFELRIRTFSVKASRGRFPIREFYVVVSIRNPQLLQGKLRPSYVEPVGSHSTWQVNSVDRRTQNSTDGGGSLALWKEQNSKTLRGRTPVCSLAEGDWCDYASGCQSHTEALRNPGPSLQAQPVNQPFYQSLGLVHSWSEMPLIRRLTDRRKHTV